METEAAPKSPPIDESPRVSPIDMTTKSKHSSTTSEEHVNKLRNTEEDTTDFEISSPENNLTDGRDLTESNDILTDSMLGIANSPETLQALTNSGSCTKANVAVCTVQNPVESNFQIKQNFVSSVARTSTTTSTLQSTMLAQRYNQCLLNKFFTKQPQHAFYNTAASPLNTFAGFRTPAPMDLIAFPRPICRTSFNGLGAFVNPIPLEQEVGQLKMCLQRINKEIQDLDESSEGNLEDSKTQLKNKLNAILEFSQGASTGLSLYPSSMLSQQQAIFQTLHNSIYGPNGNTRGHALTPNLPLFDPQSINTARSADNNMFLSKMKEQEIACLANANRKSPRPSRHCFTKQSQQRHQPYQRMFNIKSKFDPSAYSSSTVLDTNMRCEASSSICNVMSSNLEPLSVDTSRKFAAHSHILQKDKTKRLFRDSALGGTSYMAPGSLTENLTATHLRKAKLMFFYQRYPNSSTLRQFFTDVKFNRNNNAQLIKWFSNFREYYYIQVEKFVRETLQSIKMEQTWKSASANGGDNMRKQSPSYSCLRDPNITYSQTSETVSSSTSSSSSSSSSFKIESLLASSSAPPSDFSNLFTINTKSEIYRNLNTHYNKSSNFEAPESFLDTVNVTIYHFAIAIMSGKDNETGWKKQIYKIISKLDAQIPETFKSLMQ